ncbi:MAG: ABC transporter ATP-binding protein [Candidatus Syntrophopropionicum ammoniitolerans]
MSWTVMIFYACWARTGRQDNVTPVLMLLLNKIKSGSIMIDGCDLTRISAKNRAKMMAYVPQATTMAFPYEAREIVLMGRVAHLATGAAPAKKTGSWLTRQWSR